MPQSLLAAGVLITGVTGFAYAMEDPAVQRGRTFARANCAKCHSIDRVTASPLKIAPPFRTLHKRYPVDTLAEAFVEGIYTGHPSMPEFQLDPGQASDLIAFLKSLENGSNR
ncbi:cytochrome c [Nitrobacteraceae bacterium AZCC 1564]